MRSSDSLDKLAPALVRARLKMPPVHKDQVNSFFSNKYATLGAIVAAALPALLAEGIHVVQGGGRADEAGAEVITRLQHESGQFLETVLWLPIVGQKIKGGGVEPISPQSAGSSSSYGRRYGLTAALCICADEDDDGEASSSGVRGQQAPPRPQGSPRPAPATPRQAPQAQSGAPVIDGPLMPFGKTKGVPLKYIPDADLESARQWASDRDKFYEFQKQVTEELARRNPGSDLDHFPDSLREEPDDLPF